MGEQRVRRGVDRALRAVILVPRRDDGGWRDELWRFCRARWESYRDPLPIYEGHHLEDEGPFNRSQAVNRASDLADRDGRWDLALIIDSDTISDPQAVQRMLRYVAETGNLGVAHDKRYMLNEPATKKILAGDRRRDWTRREMWRTIYRDSVSCAVGVRRDMWDAVGGMDERFVGWGFEDTGFMIAVETLTQVAYRKERADCFHLWHPLQPSATKASPTYHANHILKRRYQMAHWNLDQLRLVLDHSQEADVTIPMILHRTVPEQTTQEVERYWKRFGELHPEWDLRTYRDPTDPADWPLTGDLFHRCQNGAQKAGLIRLEALFTHGGVYVDSDVEPFRPLDPLLNCRAFAAWEDERVVPDAVLGAVPQHPAFKDMLIRARQSIERGEDAWRSGPGVTTAVLPRREDVLVLPPGAFYPAHYHEKHKLGTNGERPWVFLEHKWHHSWGSAAQLAENAQQQVVVMPTDVQVAVCMPWRDSGDKWRRDAHDWCVAWWRRAGLTVFEGDGQSRSEMCNRAVDEALAWGADVLVIVDADTWTSVVNVATAVATARDTGKMTHAFTKYVMMSQSRTQRFLRKPGLTVDFAARNVQSRLDHVSGAQAITASLWRDVGGYDERFVGWGFEDQAFNLACDVLGDGVSRVEGTAIHWYHKSDPTKTRTVALDDPRVALMERYCAAAGRAPERGRVSRLVHEGKIVVADGARRDPEAMRAVLGEDGGPRARDGHPATL